MRDQIMRSGRSGVLSNEGSNAHPKPFLDLMQLVSHKTATSLKFNDATLVALAIGKKGDGFVAPGKIRNARVGQ